jgi:ABC-type multidrug transport system fused ATPase/permease subunit
MSTAVSELPDKLETVLEDGGSLSSGQVNSHTLSDIVAHNFSLAATSLSC